MPILSQYNRSLAPHVTILTIILLAFLLVIAGVSSAKMQTLDAQIQQVMGIDTPVTQPMSELLHHTQSAGELHWLDNALRVMVAILGLLVILSAAQLVYARRKTAPSQLAKRLLEKSREADALGSGSLQIGGAATGLALEINKIMALFADEEAMRDEAHQQLLAIATLDPLTGAYNRYCWREEILQQIQLAKRGYQFSLIAFDVDHLKRVNDQHGRQVGDDLLQHLVKLVLQRVRKADRLFRLSEQTFVILLPMQNEQVAEQIAQQLQALCQQFRQPALPSFTISLGVSEFRDLDSEESLLKRVTSALQEAKTLGRNQVVAK